MISEFFISIDVGEILVLISVLGGLFALAFLFKRNRFGYKKIKKLARTTSNNQRIVNYKIDGNTYMVKLPPDLPKKTVIRYRARFGGNDRLLDKGIYLPDGRKLTAEYVNIEAIKKKEAKEKFYEAKEKFCRDNQWKCPNGHHWGISQATSENNFCPECGRLGTYVSR